MTMGARGHFFAAARGLAFVALILSVSPKLAAQVEVTYANGPSSWDVQTMAKFKDALQQSKWTEALAMCSDRVRKAATNYPSAEVFLQSVVPVQALMRAKVFGCHLYRQYRDPKFPPWIAGANFVEIPAVEGKPTMRWNWERRRMGQTDLVDFDPQPLAPWLAREMARKKEQAEAFQKHHALMEEKTKRLRTRLYLVGIKQLVVGRPITVRLDLVNEGDSDLVYDAPLVRWNGSLTVTSESGQQVPFGGGTSFSSSEFKPIEAGQTVVLFDNLDLTKSYREIQRPGLYRIQFNGRGLDVGIEIARRKPDSPPDSNIVCTTNSLSSNVVEIEIKPASSTQP